MKPGTAGLHLFYGFYPYFGLGLAVALEFAISGFGVIAEDDLLVFPRLFQNLRLNMGAFNVRCAHLNLVSLHFQENLAEFKGLTRFTGKFFYTQLVTDSDLILLPAGRDDGKIILRHNPVKITEAEFIFNPKRKSRRFMWAG